MKANRTSLLALAGVVPLLTGFLFLFQPVWLFHWQDFRTGNEIISRVEAFRKNNGRLPDTMTELRLNDPNLRVFYIKLSNDEYCVFFGTFLGESETYSSRSKDWGQAGDCVGMPRW